MNETPGDWPCACVHRAGDGALEKIRIHPVTHKTCRVCGAKRPEFGKYYCSGCGKLLSRDSDKAWINSLCMKTGRTMRIYRV